jgi:hypothetical protein
MTTPIVEYIAANVLTSINEITVANTYNQTLVGQRLKRRMYLDDAWDDLSVLVVQGDEEEGNALVGSYNVSDMVQPFAIYAIVIDSDNSTTPIDTRINQVDADIKKKLQFDVTRGGYANDTIIKLSEHFTFNESFSGIIVNVNVKYRIKTSDPYTQS